MKLLVAVCLVGFTAFVHGFSVESQLQERLKDLGLYEEEETDVEHKGHCACNKYGCWCHGVNDGVKVQAVFSVDECRHDSSKSEISGTFFVGSKSIERVFPVDQFEDFCEDFEKKRFCFRVDINDKVDDSLEKRNYMKGCLRMSRPQKVDMGCFNLPLLTSSASDDSTEEFEMEIPPQLVGFVSGRRNCMCCPHGCACQGTDDGYKVVAIFSLDECNHDNKYHKVIEGFFRIGNVTFSKEFHAKEFRSFCKSVGGKNFCFKIKIYSGCGCHIRGYVALTSPKKVFLGYFRIPLMTSSCECDDDHDVTTESDEFISSDADDDNLLFI